MRTKSCFFIMLAAALWGGIGVFFNLLRTAGFTPMQAVAIRVFTAAAALTLYLFIKDRALFRIHLRDWWCFAGTAS